MKENEKVKQNLIKSFIDENSMNQMPFTADEKYLQQHTVWNDFVSDLKRKTILEDCHFVEWFYHSEYAEIPYIGNIAVQEITSTLNSVSAVAKMIKIPRRYFTAQIDLDRLSFDINGEKIMEFYKSELKKQIYSAVEKTVFDAIQNGINQSMVFSDRSAIEYEDIIHAVKNLETYDASLRIVTDPDTYDLLRTKKNTCGSHYIIENGMLDKYPCSASANLQNEIIIGDFSKIAVVSFTENFCQQLYNPYKYLDEGLMAVIASCNANSGIIDTSAFKRIKIQVESSSSSASSN